MRNWLMAAVLAMSPLLVSAPALAAVDVRDFDHPADEARYRALVEELRCPKCQNTNLAGSDAGLAADLKDRVYDQVRAGRSDAEIRQFMIDRYGDFITYRPPLRAGTLLLWCGPFLLLAVVGALLVARTRRRPQRQKPLSGDEAARLQRLLAGQSAEEPKP